MSCRYSRDPNVIKLTVSIHNNSDVNIISEPHLCLRALCRVLALQSSAEDSREHTTNEFPAKATAFTEC